MNSGNPTSYSFEGFKEQYEQLEAISTIDEDNTEGIVEAIRVTAELVVWGDKNCDKIFDHFCEKNVLGTLMKFLRAQCGDYRIKIQVIQSVSILISNLGRETSVYYLLSNPAINEIIGFYFDFNADEIVENYVTLLKSLAVRLDTNLVQFFFNDRFKNFPLLSRALRFFNHRENMIRNAVRVIVLKVFSLREQKIVNLIQHPPFVNYFVHLACFMREEWIKMDQKILEYIRESPEKVSTLIGNHQDWLYFFQDFFNLQIPEVNELLANTLLSYAILPVLVRSCCVIEEQPIIEMNLAFFLLSEIFKTINHDPLLNTIVAAIFHPKTDAGLYEYVRQYPVHPDSFMKQWDFKLQEDHSLFFSHGSKLLDSFFSFMKDHINDDTEMTNLPTHFEEHNSSRLLTYSDFSKMVRECQYMSRNIGFALLPEKFSHQGSPESSPLNRTRKLISEKNSNLPDLEPDNSLRHAVFEFLRAKDDNLVLAITQLIDNMVNKNTAVDPYLLAVCQLVPQNGPRTKEIFDLLKQRDGIEDYKIKSDPLICDCLIALLSSDPPFRIVTFKLLSRLFLAYSTDLESNSVLSKDQLFNVEAGYYKLANLMIEMINSSYLTEFALEIFKIELGSLDSAKYSTSKFVSSPLMLLPMSEDPLPNTPLQMRLPNNPVEEANHLFQVFLTYNRSREIHQSVKDSRYVDVTQMFDKFKSELYAEGQTYDFIAKNRIFCTQCVGNRQMTRWIIEEDNMFLLVEPDPYRKGYAKVITHRDIIDLLLGLDRSEPSALKIWTKRDHFKCLLRFRNPQESHEAKITLETNRNTKRLIEMSILTSWLDGCKSSVTSG